MHKISPRFSWGVTNYSPSRLDRLLNRLVHSGVSLYGSSDGDQPTDANQSDLPVVQLSFDDGYGHLAEHLPPLMEKYNIRPVLFVPTAYIGLVNRWDYSSLFKSERHLNAAEIKNLGKIGVEFGSHGHSHLDLCRMTPSSLSEELKKSKLILEDLLGRQVYSISYPFGRANNRVLDEAGESGYRAGFTMRFPTPDDPPLKKGRLPVYGYDFPFTVLQKVHHRAMYSLLKCQVNLTNMLSGGTILWHSMTGKRPLP